MATTHGVEMGPATVTKRYRSWDLDQPEREWRALTLLAEHAPGLAPRPLHYAAAETPPSVTMSRLPGEPLTAPLTDAQLTALAEAISSSQNAIPAAALAALPPRLLHPLDALKNLRAWSERVAPPPDALAARALTGAREWLRRPHLDTVFAAEPPPVFGTGDGNLANFLWDGSRVRLVDFEFSGRGDRAYELAEVAEHVSAKNALAPDALLGRFELAPSERARLPECRRLLAAFWLLALLSDDPQHPRNPPGTLAHQAGHLLALL
ncbi:phosphotransferase [Actinomadura sp. LD22]|uniref:Phosphotransferase n=1 Tax=Actinomadura physcomitrii TaxID=2650748 RepID=A0A6I4MJR0_9ACTN|nr:aminoglycoside phosphotransferase family protein [Actinomadura physcomitrii]MWA05150.1 phosphotransferase [Actinomadura physcomitrii]